MTFPPADEPSQQQRRAAIYGRSNQASAHYRPLRKGRPIPDAAPAGPPTGPAARTANRRRFVLFVVAVLVAVACGTALFGVVLANPAPMGQAPQVPTRVTPEPAIQPLPPTGRAAPAEVVPPVTGKSGARESDTTAPRRAGTTPPAGTGGDAKSTAAPATVYYQNCNKARRAGAAPLHPGDPGYRAKLDKDGNGIACDEHEPKGQG